MDISHHSSARCVESPLLLSTRATTGPNYLLRNEPNGPSIPQEGTSTMDMGEMGSLLITLILLLLTILLLKILTIPI